MESKDAQQVLFHHIKQLLPPNLSLVDEIADLLDISNDSAYRRIRGEKPLALGDLKTLCEKFKISVDQLLHLNSDSFIFTGMLTNNTDFNYNHWLQSCLDIITRVKTYDSHHMLYLAKEFPFFYYFLIPEIAAFKSFFFMKSILFYDDWKGAKFSVKDDYSRYYKIWKDISDTFASIDGTEIWNIENVTSTIRQIEFYHATGAFKSIDDVDCLFKKMLELTDHIEMQAECGVKLRLNQKPTGISGGKYNLFMNELIMGDNVQLVQLGDKHYTYVNHSILNYMMTTNARFNQYMKRTLDVIVQKSTPLSVVNEKDRLRFFNELRARIEYAKQKVLV